jgi:uncharacterized protein YndB with AHSA1/START domain
MRNDNNTDTTGREIKISRLLNAPIDLVWQVWTNPEHIANWWGPTGFTSTILKMDIKKGGEWNLTMHGPDGKVYPNSSIFREITKHEKIVYEHFAPNFIATVQFEERGDKTFLSWQMVFESRDLFLSIVKNHGADEGIKQNMEKLENYLSQKLSTK